MRINRVLDLSRNINEEIVSKLNNFSLKFPKEVAIIKVNTLKFPKVVAIIKVNSHTRRDTMGAEGSAQEGSAH